MPLIRRVLLITLMFLFTTVITAQGFQPAPPQKWNEFFCLGSELCHIGDVNGDGMDDIISFVHEEGVGAVWVGLSAGNKFNPPSSVANDIFCLGDEICAVGDVNGDGKDDIVAFSYKQTNGTVFVGLANNNAKFAKGQSWHSVFCLPDEQCLVGDVDGDGKADIVAIGTSEENEKTWVALAQTNNFGSAQLWGEIMCTAPARCELADVNGDGRDDIVEFMQTDEPISDEDIDPGDVRVALSTGSGFADKTVWYKEFCVFAEAVCTTGDFDGDADADLVMFLRDSEPDLIGFDQRRGRVDIALSDRAKFGDQTSQYPIMCIGDETCGVGDVNGDGKDDIVAFVQSTKEEPEMGDVWVATSIITVDNPLLTIMPTAQATLSTQPTVDPTQASLVVTPNLQTPEPTTPATTEEPQQAPAEQFIAGDTVLVLGTADNRALRTGPGADFQVVETLPANIVMVILEGPVETAGVNWWRVAHYTESPAEGWLAQGTTTDNWLIKVSLE